jgi:uncharacterized protein YecT (DUF1311 family)
MQIMIKYIASGGLLFAATCAYGASDQSTSCASAKISAEVDTCVARQYAEADRKMNTVYTQVMAQIDRDYKPEPRLGKELKAKIKNAQLAWLSFRDAQCAVEAFEIEQDKPAHTTTVKACMNRLTVERTTQLERAFGDK